MCVKVSGHRARARTFFTADEAELGAFFGILVVRMEEDLDVGGLYELELDALPVLDEAFSDVDEDTCAQIFGGQSEEAACLRSRRDLKVGSNVSVDTATEGNLESGK